MQIKLLCTTEEYSIEQLHRVDITLQVKSKYNSIIAPEMQFIHRLEDIRLLLYSDFNCRAVTTIEIDHIRFLTRMEIYDLMMALAGH